MVGFQQMIHTSHKDLTVLLTNFEAFKSEITKKETDSDSQCFEDSGSLV